MFGGDRAQTVAAQAIVEAGHADGAGFRQGQADGFLAAPARPVQVAGERRPAARASELTRSGRRPIPVCFAQLFIRRLISLSDL
jgi:hypothetical protein